MNTLVTAFIESANVQSTSSCKTYTDPTKTKVLFLKKTTHIRILSPNTGFVILTNLYTNKSSVVMSRLQGGCALLAPFGRRNQYTQGAKGQPDDHRNAQLVYFCEGS